MEVSNMIKIPWLLSEVLIAYCSGYKFVAVIINIAKLH